jgi:hypothetical protein
MNKRELAKHQTDSFNYRMAYVNGMDDTLHFLSSIIYRRQRDLLPTIEPYLSIVSTFALSEKEEAIRMIKLCQPAKPVSEEVARELKQLRQQIYAEKWRVELEQKAKSDTQEDGEGAGTDGAI